MIITNDKDDLYHEPSRGYIYPFFLNAELYNRATLGCLAVLIGYVFY